MIELNRIKRIAEQARSEPVYPDSRFPDSLYYRFLGRLVGTFQPDVSVELGVCGGGASLYMSRAWPGGDVIGIDHANQYPDNIDHILETCPNFVFCKGDSIALAEMVFAMYGAVGVLFIDTVHTYERTKAEFETWTPYLQEGAIVCFDDLFRPGMGQFWEELPEPKIRLDFLHLGGSPSDGGFGVVLL